MPVSLCGWESPPCSCVSRRMREESPLETSPFPGPWAALRSWSNLFMEWEKASALPCPCPLAVQLLSCPDCPEQFFLFSQHPVSSGQLSLFAGCLGRKLLPSFKATPCCFPGSCPMLLPRKLLVPRQPSRLLLTSHLWLAHSVPSLHLPFPSY